MVDLIICTINFNYSIRYLRSLYNERPNLIFAIFYIAPITCDASTIGASDIHSLFASYVPIALTSILSYRWITWNCC